jgi:hypothetical protein
MGGSVVENILKTPANKTNHCRPDALFPRQKTVVFYHKKHFTIPVMFSIIHTAILL